MFFFPMTKRKKNNPYPRLTEIGVKIVETSSFIYIDTNELREKFAEKAPNPVVAKALGQQFSELFGVQTCPVVPGVRAVYAWDAEAVIERMISGKLTGTQLLWD